VWIASSRSPIFGDAPIRPLSTYEYNLSARASIYPKFLHVYPPSFNTADSDEAAVGDEMIVRTNFLNEALADTRGRRSIRAARWLKKILLP
jgi:hypothetical protein